MSVLGPRPRLPLLWVFISLISEIFVSLVTIAGCTTEKEPNSTQNLHESDLPSTLPEISQQNLNKFNIVPSYMTKMPRYAAQVTFHDGATANFGNMISFEQISKTPNVTWPEADSDAFYTLCMIDPDGHRETIPKTSSQYFFWLIGNIPGSQVSEGDVILDYQLPTYEGEKNRFHRVVIMIHHQTEGRKNFSEPFQEENPEDFRYLIKMRSFRKRYSLDGPVAGNFIRLHIPMKLDTT